MRRIVYVNGKYLPDKILFLENDLELLFAFEMENIPLLRFFWKIDLELLYKVRFNDIFGKIFIFWRIDFELL